MDMMCNQKNCLNRATHRFTWPGENEAGICDEHVPQLKGVAEAMGLPLQLIPLSTKPKVKRADCKTCEGCGRIADSEDGEAWSIWESMPPGSDVAVRMGLVKPIPCPNCEP